MRTNAEFRTSRALRPRARPRDRNGREQGKWGPATTIPVASAEVCRWSGALQQDRDDVALADDIAGGHADLGDRAGDLDDDGEPTHEGPTPPLPATGRWPSGPVITVTFPSQEFELTVHKVYDASCAEVPSSYFSARTSDDPNVRSLARRIAFFYPDAPLAASSEYTVEARGTVDGQAWSRVWRFTTGR